MLLIVELYIYLNYLSKYLFNFSAVVMNLTVSLLVVPRDFYCFNHCIRTFL